MNSKISDETHALLRLSVAVALYNPEETRSAIDQALSAGGSVLRIKETILQNYLFSGFPNAIEGLIVLNAMLEEKKLRDENYDDLRSLDRIQEDGADLCMHIYQKNFEKLMANMKSLSPEIHQWMLYEGYGKILSRPVLTAKVRELCVVATLTALGRDRQLVSHIRGARNVGASVDEISETLDTIADWVPPTHLARARKILEDAKK